MSEMLFINGVRKSGNEVRKHHSIAATAIAKVVQTSFGPVGLDKMMVDDVGGLEVSNDGATILKLLDVEDPVAKMFVELSQQQDKEVGDGTTSVVLIAAELLRRATELIVDKGVHPSTVIEGFRMACKEACRYLASNLASKIDPANIPMLEDVARTSISSKVLGQNSDFFARMAVDAVLAIKTKTITGQVKCPITAINVLKAHGKSATESIFVNGYALNCTIASQAMPTRVVNAKIACLDMNLQKTRMNLGVHVVIDDPEQLEGIRRREIEITTERIKKILATGANVILTTKGIDDLCLKLFVEAGAMGVRRCDKEDLRRIAKATGATLVSTLANLDGDETFDASMLGSAPEVVQQRISDDECILIKASTAPVVNASPSAGSTDAVAKDAAPAVTSNMRAASVILRGATDFQLDEMERAFHDSLCAVKRVLESGSVVPGGGAVETALNIYLEAFASTISSREQHAIGEFAQALLIVPKTLAINAAKDATDLVATLRAYHNKAQTDEKSKHLKNTGLDLYKGEVRDNLKAGVLDPAMGKIKQIKAATETAVSILRLDDLIKLDPAPKDNREDDHGH
ncbi:T-complex protein 1 [Ramicandelaber brevisporus]|nr:T-complex protein 1 [Ramicandelaber brevisporus]